MRAVAAVVLVSLTGCSLITARRPPPQAEEAKSFRCTYKRGAPIFDAVSGGLLGVSSAGLAAGPSGPASQYVFAGVFGTAALGLAVSAWHGFSVASDCREAMEAWKAAHPDQEWRVLAPELLTKQERMEIIKERVEPLMGQPEADVLTALGDCRVAKINGRKTAYACPFYYFPEAEDARGAVRVTFKEGRAIDWSAKP